MISPDAVAPLFFRILADPGGAPAALLLAGGGVITAAQVQPCGPLAAMIACKFTPGGVDDEGAAILRAAGWTELAPEAIARIDGSLQRAALAAQVRWIDGDWCMAPPAKPVGAQAASRTLALQLVQRVAADADTHEIESLLRQDPALSYQLLRLVNSLGMGSGRRITSFSQALIILGRQQLRRWLNLMLFAARDGDVRSGMLLARVGVRARAMELLAKERGCDKLTQEQAFMTGMFSLLGVLFGMELADVLAPLSLGEGVHAALLGHEGELGALLALVEAAERGDMAGVAQLIAPMHLPAAGFNGVALDASTWMLGALKGSQGGSGG